MLKIYLYGYLNQVQSSRRLERECRRNIELMWLTGQLTPDFKTIADFRRDNGTAIRKVCRRFVALCRNLHLLDEPRVAIDGSKFKAVNHRERNFTHDRLKRRIAAARRAAYGTWGDLLEDATASEEASLLRLCRHRLPASSLALRATRVRVCGTSRLAASAGWDSRRLLKLAATGGRAQGY
jgi:hypothetical protein